MKQGYEVTNLRQIKVKYISPTNSRGSRVKIYEPKRYDSDKVKSVTLSYDYSIGDIMEQAYRYLVDKGFNVIARASEYDNYIFLCDNWSEEYEVF